MTKRIVVNDIDTQYVSCSFEAFEEIIEKGGVHADISITMNTYTHVKYEDAKAEVIRLEKVI